jgi:hypothetical protein
MGCSPRWLRHGNKSPIKQRPMTPNLHPKIQNLSVYLSSSFCGFSCEFKTRTRFRRSHHCRTPDLSAGDALEQPGNTSRAWTKGVAVASLAQPSRNVKKQVVASIFYKNLTEPCTVARVRHRLWVRQSPMALPRLYGHWTVLCRLFLFPHITVQCP